MHKTLVVFPTHLWSLALYLTTLASAASDRNAEVVVTAYLQATGGPEAYRAIEDRREAWTLLFHRPNAKRSAVLHRHLKRPSKVREEWELKNVLPGKNLNFVQIYDGNEETGWTIAPRSRPPPQGIPGFPRYGEKYVDDFFLHLKEEGCKLVKAVCSDEKVEGELCAVVELSARKPEPRFRFFFSKKTHLLRKKAWTIDGPNGPVAYALLYSRWQKVQNPKAPDKPILCPFSIRRFSGSKLVEERTLKKIRINVGFGDEVFKNREPIASKEPSEKHIYHILFAKKSKARDVRQEIMKAGGNLEAFKKAARKYSLEPFPMNVDLGWVNETTPFEPTFLKAALKVPVGKMSEPVHTRFGWHLIFAAEER